MEPTKATTRARITQGRSGLSTVIVIAAIPISRWHVVVRLRPIMKVLRRSSRSIMYSAMKPPTTAITPGAMLAMRAAPASKPDSISTICP